MRQAMGVLALAMLALVVACGGTETVVIATAGDYHPFDFINDEGEIDGLDRELGDELCRRADLACEWTLNEWDTLIPNLLAEEFDVILAGMSITAEREELIDFTEAYYPPVPSVYLAAAGAGDEAIDGRVGVAENTIYSDYYAELGVPVTLLEGSIDAAEAILGGDVDAVLVDHGYAAEKVAQHPERLAIVGPSVPLDSGLGIGVRSNSDLRADLDEALASMKADGSLDALLLKWVGPAAATFN